MHRQTIQFLKTPDNVRLAYAVSGSGPLLVKTANWLNHLEYDWESPVWSHCFQFLSDHFTLIRYDERGCGLSDWNCPEQSFEKWVEDLEALADHNELDRFPLLGISQGAAVAIEYAYRHPERVSHLVLLGGFALGRNKRGENERAQVVISLIKTGWESQNPAFRQMFGSMFVPNGTHEHHHWFSELCRNTASAENAIKIQTVGQDVDVSHRLAHLDVPTLIFHAEEDAVVPVNSGRYMASEIPNAQFVQLKSQNHLLLEDEPAWPQFCEELLRFLAPATTGRPAVKNSKVAALTEKERTILRWLGEGLSNNAIAEKVFLSEKTIRNHLTNIYDKLGVSSRAEAIVLTRSLKSL